MARGQSQRGRAHRALVAIGTTGAIGAIGAIGALVLCIAPRAALAQPAASVEMGTLPDRFRLKTPVPATAATIEPAATGGLAIRVPGRRTAPARRGSAGAAATPLAGAAGGAERASGGEWLRPRWLRNELAVVRIARHAKSEGVPFARLWEGQEALIAVGVSNRGVPGLYVARRAKD